MPEHCLFDHVHNQSRCWDFDDWNRTASGACAERGMRVKDFAMLLPCGIDVFSGVEFVCCPRHNEDNKAAVAKKGEGRDIACRVFLLGLVMELICLWRD